MRAYVTGFSQPLRTGIRRCVERRVPLAVGVYGVVAATLLELTQALHLAELLGRDTFGALAVLLLCGLPVVAVLSFLRSP